MLLVWDRLTLPPTSSIVWSMTITTQRDRLDRLMTERASLLAEIDRLDAKRLNDDLDIMAEEIDYMYQLRDRKAAIAAESIKLQIALKTTPSKPRAQYWDDDAPGGVTYE